MNEEKQITEHLKIAGLTCRSCWWQEGGRCYVKPCERIPNPEGVGSISTKMADSVCHQHTSKMSVLSKFFPSGMLKIASNENEKAKGNDTGLY